MTISGKPWRSVEDTAHYLAYGYWDRVRDVPRKFDVDLTEGGEQAISFNHDLLNATGKWFVQAALDSWSDTTGLVFTYSEEAEPDIVFGRWTNGAYAVPGPITEDGHYQNSVRINLDPGMLKLHHKDVGMPNMQVTLHEIGHALGLGHPNYYLPFGPSNFDTDAAFANDTTHMSVMSYFDPQDSPDVDVHFWGVATPSIADVMAIRELYGTRGNLRLGDDVYGVGGDVDGTYRKIFHDSRYDVAFVLVDDGGIDTFRTAESVDLRPGLVGDAPMVIAPGTIIENIDITHANGTYVGNEADNTFFMNSIRHATLQAEGGFDTLDLTGVGEGYHVVLIDNWMDEIGPSYYSPSTIISFERVIGTGFADWLKGSTDVDDLQGRDGDDLLWGYRGDDTLLGGAGADTLKGGLGADILHGGGGADMVYGDGGADRLWGANGDDALYGGAGDDRVRGNDGDDVLRGNGGDDDLRAGDGADRVHGDHGSDWLMGGAGADILHGGAGDDVLFGGAGADVFWFTPGDGLDRIRDWQPGVDRIDLSAWDFDDPSELETRVQSYDDAVGLRLDDGSMLIVEGVTTLVGLDFIL